MTEIQSPVLKKKSGCGKGCAIGCLTVVLLAVVGGFLCWRGFKQFTNLLIADYTATAPATLPTVTVSDQDASDLVKRVDAFTRAVKEGQSGQALTLTSRDINVLIQKNPKWSDLAGKVYVTLEGDRIHGDASIPLEKLWGPLKGRWLNGSGTFRVETAAGRLLVFMDALSVRGKPIPDSFMAGVRGKNLAEDAAKNPEATALMQKIDSVTVRDGTLRVVAK